MGKRTLIRKAKIFRKLITGCVLLAPAMSYAQEECGTITKSIRLESDCRGPLIVGANNITVNLNGYTVLAPTWDPDLNRDRGSVEVFDKHGVTVKNGTINGLSIGLYVKGGHHNTFTNLVPLRMGEGSTYAHFVDVKNTVVSRISVRAYEDTNAFRFSGNNSTLNRLNLRNIDGSPLAGIRGKNLTISNSLFDGGFTGNCSPIALTISGSTVTGNTFNGGVGDPSAGLCLKGNRNRVKQNTIVSRSGSGLKLLAGKNNVIAENKITAEEENPPTYVDIDGGPDACKNKWSNNDFTTDSEGDGPEEGCIQ
jgi:hypothetical protein